jgi:hypothetical protein
MGAGVQFKDAWIPAFAEMTSLNCTNAFESSSILRFITFADDFKEYMFLPLIIIEPNRVLKTLAYRGKMPLPPTVQQCGSGFQPRKI